MAEGMTGGLAAVGQCVRVVPSRVKPEQAGALLAAHREHHTPAVRRQPGFVAKLLLQAEADPGSIVMLLVWESSEQAIAWTRLPEHDAIGARIRQAVDRVEGGAGEAPRGGYRVLEAVAGSGA